MLIVMNLAIVTTEGGNLYKILLAFHSFSFS